LKFQIAADWKLLPPNLPLPKIHARPKPSRLIFKSERQAFLGLKVCHIAQRVAVDVGAGFAAHFEHEGKIQLKGRVLGGIGRELDLLKHLSPLTTWGFAVRTPIDIHKVLAKLILIGAYEVYTLSNKLYAPDGLAHACRVCYPALAATG
jgi:hypothetical protein